MLAEMSVFESKFMELVPGVVTHEEIEEWEDEFLSFAGSLPQMVEFFGKNYDYQTMISKELFEAMERTKGIGKKLIELKNGATAKLKAENNKTKQ